MNKEKEVEESLQLAHKMVHFLANVEKRHRVYINAIEGDMQRVMLLKQEIELMLKNTKGG